MELLIGDLACQGDVRALAAQVCQGHDRLDVLIHNAGAVNTTRRVTVDGVEATLATNHLAPFLLTNLLAPLLQATPSSRVVTVSSYMHTRVKDIPWDDLQAEHDYSAAATYNLTKLLNLLFTYELARRWAGTSVTANALHPGWPLKTNLGREQTGPGALSIAPPSSSAPPQPREPGPASTSPAHPTSPPSPASTSPAAGRRRPPPCPTTPPPPNACGHAARNSVVCRRRKRNRLRTGLGWHDRDGVVHLYPVSQGIGQRTDFGQLRHESAGTGSTEGCAGAVTSGRSGARDGQALRGPDG